MESRIIETPWEERIYRRIWIAALVVAAVLRVVLIERHGVWMDELTTVDTIKMPYGEMIGQRLRANHLPLYFMMEKAWTDLFGRDEWAIRAIAAIFGWMAVWATSRLARRLGGWRLGAYVAAAGAVQQLWLVASLEARMYSVLTWAAAESMDAYLAWARDKDLESNRRKWALARWTIVTAFGLNIHMLFLPVFIMETVDAAIRWFRRETPVRGFVMAWIANLALCIPVSIAWATYQTKFESAIQWKSKGAAVMVRAASRLTWGDDRTAPWEIFQVLSALLCVAAVMGFVRAMTGSRASSQIAPGALPRPHPARRELLLFASTCALYTYGIYYASMRWDSPVAGTERYYLAMGPFFVILGWTGLLYFPWINRRGVAVLAGIALMIQATYTTAHFVGVGDGLREAVAEVSKESERGRGVVFVMGEALAQPLREFYGASLPEDCLVLSRREMDRDILRQRLAQYGVKHSEFWILSYREKHSPIHDVVKEDETRIHPVNASKDIGEATIQLFRMGEPANSGLPPAL